MPRLNIWPSSSSHPVLMNSTVPLLTYGATTCNRGLVALQFHWHDRQRGKVSGEPWQHRRAPRLLAEPAHSLLLRPEQAILGFRDSIQDYRIIDRSE